MCELEPICLRPLAPSWRTGLAIEARVPAPQESQFLFQGDGFVIRGREVYTKDGRQSGRHLAHVKVAQVLVWRDVLSSNEESGEHVGQLGIVAVLALFRLERN